MKFFKITETFYGGKGETTFLKCILCAEDDAAVFDYLCGDMYGELLEGAKEYDKANADSLTTDCENEQRLDIIKNRTTEDYLGDEIYYGVSEYVWEEVTLTTDEALALDKFDLLK